MILFHHRKSFPTFAQGRRKQGVIRVRFVARVEDQAVASGIELQEDLPGSGA
jgi:hypothetical protein